MDVLVHVNEERYEELAYDAAQTICDIAGIDITLVKKVKENGREVACMCKAWDDHKKAGIKEGVLETRVESIRNLMKNLSITMEEAMDVLEIPKSDRERCVKLVN